MLVSAESVLCKEFSEALRLFDQHFFWSILATLPCTLRIHLKHMHMHACMHIDCRSLSLSLSLSSSVKIHKKIKLMKTKVAKIRTSCAVS